MATYPTNTYRLAAGAMLARAAEHRFSPPNVRPLDYIVTPDALPGGPPVWRLTHASGAHVDSFRTRSGAEHARRLLQSGACVVEPHRPVGCRVQPVTVAQPANVRPTLPAAAPDNPAAFELLKSDPYRETVERTLGARR